MSDWRCWLSATRKSIVLRGSRGTEASQGDAFYAAPNPPFGAVFTYHLKSVV